jgi:hypothetical protein
MLPTNHHFDEFFANLYLKQDMSGKTGLGSYADGLSTIARSASCRPSSRNWAWRTTPS